jgi:hypothetical protein
VVGAVYPKKVRKYFIEADLIGGAIVGQPVGYPPGTSTREERMELLAADENVKYSQEITNRKYDYNTCRALNCQKEVHS